MPINQEHVDEILTVLKEYDELDSDETPGDLAGKFDDIIVQFETAEELAVERGQEIEQLEEAAKAMLRAGAERQGDVGKGEALYQREQEVKRREALIEMREGHADDKVTLIMDLARTAFQGRSERE